MRRKPLPFIADVRKRPEKERPAIFMGEFRRLVEQPGFQIVLDFMRTIEDEAENDILNAGDANAIMKASGAKEAIRTLRDLMDEMFVAPVEEEETEDMSEEFYSRVFGRELSRTGE